MGVELAGEIAFFAVPAELFLKRVDDFLIGEGVFCRTAAINSVRLTLPVWFAARISSRCFRAACCARTPSWRRGLEEAADALAFRIDFGRAAFAADIFAAGGSHSPRIPPAPIRACPLVAAST